ncbi:MAG TPA: PD-(D/E)XK nuclease family protein, partial [Chthoniobacterales bacterium]|nr:PD-(D/E)XK nuclease family protein [Chthoniobacterales bacterium]
PPGVLPEIEPGRGTPSLRDNPATLYGSWWHTLFQHFPWKTGVAQWETAFDAMQPSSPQPERSAREWRKVHDGLANSKLAEFVRRSSTVVQTESPFLWSVDDQRCLEGVIDLLVIDQAGRECWLVDWKTNDIGRSDAEHLRMRYLPQLAAYWKVVTSITGFSVHAALFPTALGELLLYKRDELSTEWARLEKLPPHEIGAEVAPDAATPAF